MRRRHFIAGLGGAAAAQLILPSATAGAQQQKRLPVVGFVLGVAPPAGMAGTDPAIPFVRAFVHSLRDLGWAEGRTVIIERRSAETAPERAPAIFAELLARGVDVIMLGGERWLHDAALAATRTIPVVAAFREDPVAAGLIASLARPGGNLTGVASVVGPEFMGKRLQLLAEIAPGITRVAFLAPRQQLAQIRNAAPPAGVTVVPVEAEVTGQLDEAFATVLRERADALMLEGAGIIYFSAQRIAAFAKENRLPAVYSQRESVEAGGLMSYGSNVNGNWRQAARMVDRFLKGARPGDVPVELPTTFELVINGATAKALGLTIPTALLARADEVIE